MNRTKHACRGDGRDVIQCHLRGVKARRKVQLDRKRAEKTVADPVAELAEILRELKSFSYAMAHDLRDPLRVIQGYAHILKEDHAGEMTAAARNCVVRMDAAAQHMHALVTDVLLFAAALAQRIPSGGS